MGMLLLHYVTNDGGSARCGGITIFRRRQLVLRLPTFSVLVCRAGFTISLFLFHCTMTMTFDLNAIKANIVYHKTEGYKYTYGTAGFRAK